MASWGEYKTIPGLLAGAALTTHQYKIVKYASTAGEVVLATSATSLIAGVLMNEPADGEAAEVAYQGLVKVYMSTNISAGERLGVNGSGYAVELGSTAGYTVVGAAVEANSTSGNIKRAILSINEI